jgi:outer membrane protein OmpA-like peptidoglycan-associated protein
MSYCTVCGTPRVAGGAFCTACGAAQPPLNAAPQSTGAAASPPASVSNVGAPLPGPPVAPGSGSGLRTLIIVAVVILLIVIGLSIAGTIYAVRTAKQKADVLLNHISSSIASSASAPSANRPSSGSTETPASAVSGSPPALAPSSFPAWRPTTSSAPTGSGPAPLKVGMLVVTAIGSPRGDYESMKQILGIDASGTTLSYHAETPKPGTGVQGSTGRDQATSVHRIVLSQDLNSAHEYAEVFGTNDPPSFPGTTAISASREVLAELEQKGATSFTFRPNGAMGAIGSLVSNLSAITGIDTKDVGGGSLDKLTKVPCSLRRVGTGLFAFPVLLNEQPATLPALRAGCATDDGPAEFYILDQPDYPLMLAWKLGQGSQLQVIKITYPPEQKSEQRPAESAIEQQLKEKKKVDIYGIYFDFASDQLKPESTPVLEEIAGVLKDDPDWKLTVSGHTDNVGGDVYNLDLSKRRAAAVKQALVTQYHVAPERLSTDGFGASRPVDTNDTLAGRARNRRVELTRE